MGFPLPEGVPPTDTCGGAEPEGAACAAMTAAVVSSNGRLSSPRHNARLDCELPPGLRRIVEAHAADEHEVVGGGVTTEGLAKSLEEYVASAKSVVEGLKRRASP
jgi:hypothetical protein